MVAVSSLVLSVSGDSESEPVPEIGLRPGKRSASNTLEMISALSEREPDVAWDILLASEDIDLKPLFRNETLAAVEVELFEEQSARYHPNRSASLSVRQLNSISGLRKLRRVAHRQMSSPQIVS